jgi:TRAP-type mannitol/chloroaromatic compound transport system substrate-binding protein
MRNALGQDTIDAANTVKSAKAEQISFVKINGVWQWSSFPERPELLQEMMQQLGITLWHRK